ncbi:Protein of uncharacterised function (DUF1471) [Pragia fontium]|uniref:YdgH/BhsA/McbA-like domain-containing protein n=1 Tax=Pragia fontium TaxID=82985 RepID=A0ABQ5LFV5_9GAMM|nr:DUF1471 family protein YdgH [Pragia fontium]AKJ42141.1 hypothetical protein QQ39_08615 [Pragia fontium]GKX61811.1 hypothetical protein SOASR032_03800 [Pragia fontium]SUB82392.1 Protein of uncharacterised function (DUF1471) [Pragia fontium]
MKLKTTLITTALLSAMSFSVFSAQELTPEKADELVPFDRITFSGRYDSIYDANRAASKRADKQGAAAFFVRDISEQSGNGGNSRVIADLYHADAKAASTETQYRVFNGVRELPRTEASQLEPFDTVSIRGFYPVQNDVNNAVAEQAKAKGADAFFIVRQIDANRGANQFITAYIYKKDAPKRKVQAQDNPIPADSEAGKEALAAGGAAAAEVEIPNVASSTSISADVGRFFETQTSSEGSRYTVTLKDGTKIEELNNATAMKMTPFDSITFTDNFSNSTDMSEQIAKRTAAKGGKYYHITRQWEKNGGNITVTADIFK